MKKYVAPLMALSLTAGCSYGNHESDNVPDQTVAKPRNVVCSVLSSLGIQLGPEDTAAIEFGIADDKYIVESQLNTARIALDAGQLKRDLDVADGKLDGFIAFNNQDDLSAVADVLAAESAIASAMGPAARALSVIGAPFDEEAQEVVDASVGPLNQARDAVATAHDSYCN